LFVDNIFLKGSLFMRTIRSPVKSGKLLSVDCPVLPEGYRLIRARDIPGKNHLAGESAANTDFNPAFGHPILAETELLYEGQPVALLVGPEPSELARFESMILVNAEEAERPKWVYAERDITIETDAKARAARNAEGNIPLQPFTLVETCHKTPAVEHNAPECTGAVAFFEGTRCVIHTATQWPVHVRRSVAGMLNKDEAAIVIGCESLGVHFDAKLWYPALIACQAALAALLTGKPVKFMLSREEERLYSPRRVETEIRIHSALDENGRVLETALTIGANLGACGFFADEIIDRISLAALGLYRLGTVRLKAQAVGTASIPKGAFAGFGMAQGFFAIERHTARIADELRVSPLDWKMERNIVKPGGALAKTPIGLMVKKPLTLRTVVDTVSAQSDFCRKWAAYDLLRRREKPAGDRVSPIRGIGLAVAYQGAGLLYHQGGNPLPRVIASLEDNELVIKCAAAKETGLKIELWKELALQAAPTVKGVRYEGGGNDWGDDPATLSRDHAFIGGLVEQAAQSAALLPSGQEQTSEARYQSEPVQNWAGKQCDQKTFAYPALCAAVAEVEIDRVEYKPVIRGIWLCIDGGKIMSLQDASNTLTIAGIAALAWAQGKRDLPNIRDMPNIKIDFIPSDSDHVCGFEELAFSVIPSAYASAISQALDHSFDSLPIRSLEIWRVMRPKTKTGGDEE
jgi:CO/xanthine dehydrogenase Mo-binding subunit